ncbi:MAG: cation acetate symporter [Lentisphaeria bacterium]|nr:cation acetate symporter [Lentisphaeria bacterium]
MFSNEQNIWSFGWVVFTFSIYIGIALYTRAGSSKEFYVAGGGVPPLANGLATAADWMSAASFLGMAGLISFNGYNASTYLMGWTGGYVLLALCLAPYLRKFGKFTVPDFIGDRYYSDKARVIALLCAIFISFTYIAGQMRGVGVVFSRFLNVSVEKGVLIGMAIVFCYAVLGGMKGITYTQVAQYCVLIFAFMVPAFFISIQLTGSPIPQIGLGAEIKGQEGVYLLDKLDQILVDLGFDKYTENLSEGWKLNMFATTCALMVGTAGLPHVIIRFFTVPNVRDARKSAFYALFFIAILYTTAPAVAAFSMFNMINTVSEKPYKVEKIEVTETQIATPLVAVTEVTEGVEIADGLPAWFYNWEKTGLLNWYDKNNDGKIQYYPGEVMDGKWKNAVTEDGEVARGLLGQVLPDASLKASENENELSVDRDIMVLANPEIANLHPWVIGLVAAGGLAAALSTAAGLLLVISTSVSHDLMKKVIMPEMSDKTELFYARGASIVAIAIAGYFGINPPGFVAEVVGFAFGFAAASFFPAILLGIFYKKFNKQGAITGMLVGLLSTAGYVIYFKFINPSANVAENHFLGIGPNGFGFVGMILNFVVGLAVSAMTPEPPQEIQNLVEEIRIPNNAGQAQDH